jgi:hypothetical protein
VQNFKLIYFQSCPNIESTRSCLREAGISEFDEINQDSLSADHPYRAYSSPTILMGNEVVLGNKLSSSSSAACSLERVSSEELKRRLTDLVRSPL